jgi:hypothetical protein
MEIEFLSSIAVIAPDPPISRLDGCKHFAVWPLLRDGD